MPIEGDAAPARPTYTNVTPLTRGGMSLIYKAQHEGFDKPVIQKVVATAHMPAAIAFAEPRLMDQLRHPQLVPVLDTQPDRNDPRLVVFTMPYYREGSIRFALDNGYRFSIHRAVDIGCDLLTALGHLHTHGLVHRDVKTDNVLLTDGVRGGVLSDVGIAARLGAAGTAPGGVGTYLFMPPEAFGPGSLVGPPMDIYAAGLTIFEMVNGPLDYARLAGAPAMNRLARGLRGIPDSALEFSPHVPPELRRVIRKAIRVDPADRYPGARTFVQALRRLKLVDWVETSRGSGLEGRWEGTWPPRLPISRRRTYAVEVTPTRKGFVAVALQRTAAAGPWRRFGVTDVRLAATDLRALSQFFSAVNDKAAQLLPAR
jgi:eukaryotic-like serine/threonine-protein kinase